MIGYALCGSFCTHSASLAVLEELCKSHSVLPIVSEIVGETDTRFGNAADTLAILSALCRRPVIRTIRDAEPIGPKTILDALVIAPCTGNTLAKIVHHRYDRHHGGKGTSARQSTAPLRPCHKRCDECQSCQSRRVSESEGVLSCPDAAGRSAKQAALPGRRFHKNPGMPHCCHGRPTAPPAVFMMSRQKFTSCNCRRIMVY